jgi:hypothetical protein
MKRLDGRPSPHASPMPRPCERRLIARSSAWLVSTGCSTPESERFGANAWPEFALSQHFHA